MVIAPPEALLQCHGDWRSLGVDVDARDGLHDGAAVAWAAGHGDGARGQVAGRHDRVGVRKVGGGLGAPDGARRRVVRPRRLLLVLKEAQVIHLGIDRMTQHTLDVGINAASI